MKHASGTYLMRIDINSESIFCLISTLNFVNGSTKLTDVIGDGSAIGFDLHGICWDKCQQEKGQNDREKFFPLIVKLEVSECVVLIIVPQCIQPS
ncbi:hypothetical protein KY290_033629 [Solanum tuberosum]|uniref:Uncharacterized protein n=1 Tax=Solanum tuberosum TaxID=4113 RepID=A0ABQ7U197_SOLTU|nr:hypothetical protein KY289_032996 [Solanum tuberosum]KAH0647637.1 hypothetical protein KY285_032885 [Solanum tuberosum]KAH0740586.1 hypothetical protein KY290_033629 [Solanum tuberosum]